MAEFEIRTTDNIFSLVTNNPQTTVFNPQTNNKTADTQGFLRKTQKGKVRIQAVVNLRLSQSDLENIITPMSVHPADVVVTFDRAIPLRGSKVGNFTFEDFKLIKELDGKVTGNEYEIELILTEVLTP